MGIIDKVRKVSDTVWEIPVTYKEGMRVPARIIATEKLMREMDEAVYEQISNVATLPGITRYAFCMPDGHSGYGFPIGGVAAMDVHEGGGISARGHGDGKHLPKGLRVRPRPSRRPQRLRRLLRREATHDRAHSART